MHSCRKRWILSKKSLMIWHKRKLRECCLRRQHSFFVQIRFCSNACRFFMVHYAKMHRLCKFESIRGRNLRTCLFLKLARLLQEYLVYTNCHHSEGRKRGGVSFDEKQAFSHCGPAFHDSGAILSRISVPVSGGECEIFNHIKHKQGDKCETKIADQR